MGDVFDSAKRSWIMSQIKAKDTWPELLVRRFLHKNGFRYRINVKSLPGKPDIVLTKYKAIIFVHGCFWHRHEGCSKAQLPKTRTQWWEQKLDRNSENDKKNQTLLRQAGWNVITVWQCDLKPAVCQKNLKKITIKIHKKYPELHSVNTKSI